MGRLLLGISSLCFLVAASACLGSELTETSDQPESTNGVCTVTPGSFLHQIDVDGVQRQAIVYVPPNVTNCGAPAVFMFHGGSGTGQKFYRISGWRDTADRVGAIAVFPSALHHCFFDLDDSQYKTFTSWSNGKFGNQYILCSQQELDMLPPNLRAAADHPEADDIGFVEATIDLLNSDYGVDLNRVYSAGFSNGAAFSGRVGIELSERIAAFAMASGQLEVNSVATRPISAISHLGAIESGYPVDETVWQIPEYQTVITKLLDALNLTDTFSPNLRSVNGVDVSRLSFETSAVGETNAAFALMIDDLPHVYPNGINHPIHMADRHWEFFSAHTLDE